MRRAGGAGHVHHADRLVGVLIIDHQAGDATSEPDPAWRHRHPTDAPGGADTDRGLLPAAGNKHGVMLAVAGPSRPPRSGTC